MALLVHSLRKAPTVLPPVRVKNVPGVLPAIPVKAVPAVLRCLPAADTADEKGAVLSASFFMRSLFFFCGIRFGSVFLRRLLLFCFFRFFRRQFRNLHPGHPETVHLRHHEPSALQ